MASSSSSLPTRARAHHDRPRSASHFPGRQRRSLPLVRRRDAGRQDHPRGSDSVTSGLAVGITGIGVHVPRYRLSGATLGAVWGGSGGGTRAVANHDEDSLTMAAEAGLAALGNGGSAGLDLVCFSSTTSPYSEKSAAAVIASVL